MASPLSLEFGTLLGIGLLMVAISFATLLPFLILSSASPFYRERLKALLRVKPETPPLIAPLPDASLNT
jgi:predicted RND superfamily exporter protein